MKILLLENIHPDAGAVFTAAGHAVERVPHSPPERCSLKRSGTSPFSASARKPV